MRLTTVRRAICLGAALATLSACGEGAVDDSGVDPRVLRQREATPIARLQERETIFDLFGGGPDANVTVAVNRYIWNAALDVLDFMPVEAADPFSGVIVYGYGTPPGSGRAYRATVYVRDPALDARSLNVSVQTQSGPASLETVRAIEDAILTRARQMRVRDARL